MGVGSLIHSSPAALAIFNSRPTKFVSACFEYLWTIRVHYSQSLKCRATAEHPSSSSSFFDGYEFGRTILIAGASATCLPERPIRRVSSGLLNDQLLTTRVDKEFCC